MVWAETFCSSHNLLELHLPLPCLLLDLEANKKAEENVETEVKKLLQEGFGCVAFS